jgi:hypothetical protein
MPTNCNHQANWLTSLVYWIGFFFKAFLMDVPPFRCGGVDCC